MRQHTPLAAAVVLVLLLVCVPCTSSEQQSPAGDKHQQAPNARNPDRLARVKAVWRRRHHIRPSELSELRHTAWDMFDHGFSNYMQHAFPKDNLMPLSCQGQDWQGGLALTLVDSLDTLALMNRRSDLQEAVEHLRHTLSFDKDTKVHVFETTIRVLGGLLSGHVLLQQDPGLVPGYNGSLLHAAQDLGDRLMAAFNTPSGLPGGHVHLQKGMVAGENISCTACAGTLLLEFGLLSKLTGNNRYLNAAHHAASVLYEARSPLGLVGSSFHVGANTWSHLGSTIGPGSDSYYEYLLKAYLMFGDRQYLDMFIELYAATMRHMKLPGPIPSHQQATFGSAFLLDVHMDSGRLLKPWVSSLGAFWPAMQVLAGQSDDAAALHANFTSAWATWGWLPEVFGVDLSAVHPEDPGYNLRPEHIESTWYLAALTGDPAGHYRGLAANMLRVLNDSWVGCGYAPISDVATGVHTDLMESYFLSETVKYLYLSFVDSGALLDFYVLSTEGHLMTSHAHPLDAHVEEDDYLEVLQLHHTERLRVHEERHQQQRAACLANTSSARNSNNANTTSTSSCPAPNASLAGLSSDTDPNSDAFMAELSLVGEGLAALPENCRPLCVVRSEPEERSVMHALHRALPLLPLEFKASRRIRYRRCVACIKTTQALAEMPQDPLAAQLARFNFGQKSFHTPTFPPSSSSTSTSSSSSTGSKKKGGSSRAAAVAAARPSALPHHGSLSTDIEALPSTQGVVVLAQAVCLMRVVRRAVECETLRAVTALDTTSMLPQNAVVMQLSGLKVDALPSAAPALLLSLETEEGGPSTLHLAAALAGFGPDLPVLREGCMAAMLASPPDQQQLPECPLGVTVNPYWQPTTLGGSSSRGSGSRTSSSSKGGKMDVWREGVWHWQQQQQLQADPWLRMTPSSSTCAAVRAQQQQQQQQGDAAAAGAAADGPSGSSHNSSISITRMLLGSCLGYDPSTYLARFWLPQPAFFDPSHPCSSPTLTAAATRSADRTAAPPSAHLPVTAPLVAAEPANACKRLRNAATLAGSIAVVKRGGCSFIEKAMAAAAAGAYGVVVLNNESPGQLLTMSDDGSGRSPDVPTVMLEAEDSKTLQYWLDRRPLVGTLLGHPSPPAPGKGELRSVAETLQQQRREAQEREQRRLKEAREKERQQQQREKQQRDGKGGDGADREHGKGEGGGEEGRGGDVDEILQTRIDLFVPGRSQHWLQQHVIKAGIDGQTAYQSLAQDPRVLKVLQVAYVRNKLHSSGPQQQQQQQPLTGGQRAASSAPVEAAPRGQQQPMGHSGG